MATGWSSWKYWQYQQTTDNLPFRISVICRWVQCLNLMVVGIPRYTDKASIKGIKGGVDCSRFSGTQEELEQLVGM
jgi:hypothetical protein